MNVGDRRRRRTAARRVAVRGGVLLWGVFTLVAVVAGLAAASSVGGAISGAASRPRTQAQIHDALGSSSPSPAGPGAAAPGASASGHAPARHHATHPGQSPSGGPTTSGPGANQPTGVGRSTSTSLPSTSPTGGSHGGHGPGPSTSPGSGGNDGSGNGGPGSGQGGDAVRATLSSGGGTVVASCRNGQVTLVTWSPAIGYRVHQVVAGPASEVEISFEADNRHEVSMAITCGSNGSPRATVHGDSRADE